MKTYKINVTQFAAILEAKKNCQKSGNKEWEVKHDDRLCQMFENFPSGGGIDSPSNFLEDESTAQRLVFSFSYHHMNENGYYDGWTDHKLIITPVFGGFDLRITGRDKNGVKEYLYDLFNDVFHI